MEKTIISKCKWGGVQFLAGQLLYLFKSPEKIDDWMVIPFGAIVFTIIHFKMVVCLSQNTKINQKTSHGSYRTTNTSRLLSRAENDNRYSRQSLLHLPDEKRLERKAQQS
jgi:hypothetical protein